MNHIPGCSSFVSKPLTLTHSNMPSIHHCTPSGLSVPALNHCSTLAAFLILNNSWYVQYLYTEYTFDHYTQMPSPLLHSSTYAQAPSYSHTPANSLPIHNQQLCVIIAHPCQHPLIILV